MCRVKYIITFIVDFSLSDWYTQNEQTPGNQLEDWAVSSFLDDIGLSPFLDVTQCNVDPNFVYVNSKGWTNGRYSVRF